MCWLTYHFTFTYIIMLKISWREQKRMKQWHYNKCVSMRLWSPNSDSAQNWKYIEHANYYLAQGNNIFSYLKFPIFTNLVGPFPHSLCLEFPPIFPSFFLPFEIIKTLAKYHVFSGHPWVYSKCLPLILSDLSTQALVHHHTLPPNIHIASGKKQNISFWI